MSISEMLAPSETDAHKTKVYNPTFIHNIPKLLHLAMILDWPSQLFLLPQKFIKISYAQPWSLLIVI